MPFLTIGMKKAKDIFLNKILKKKRIWIPLLLVIIITAIALFSKGNNAKNVVTDTVKYADLKETILATGQVVSSTDLNLSFNTNGVVKAIKVKVGDKVKAGQLLANIDQQAELAALTQARGALAAANARYRRILEGATSEEVAVSQTALNNAKRDLENTKSSQATLIKNAYNNLLNSSPEALPEDGGSGDQMPTISGTYNLGKEGEIKLEIYNSSGGLSFQASGLTSGIADVSSITPQPIGNSGLYITFPSDTYLSTKEWVIEIPNKKGATYLTNYNAYQTAQKNQEQAIANAEAMVSQREAELALKRAQARPSDIQLAEAEIISAEGQMQQAQARYNDTVITAPLDGTITSIDIKPGELASAMKEVIILQDVSNIYLEANINEANIASIHVGLPIDITFDAFGSERTFKGTVTKVDPSSTLVSGVVNYKITANVEVVNTEELRPGMTANMTIKAREKNHVLVIPSRSILVDENGKQTIRLVKDARTKKWNEVEVTTGLEGDGGMVEVLSGLKENDEIVVLLKTN